MELQSVYMGFYAITYNTCFGVDGRIRFGCDCDAALANFPSYKHLTLLLAYTVSRAHHIAHHGHQDANCKKTYQAIQVRIVITIP